MPPRSPYADQVAYYAGYPEEVSRSLAKAFDRTFMPSGFPSDVDSSWPYDSKCDCFNCKKITDYRKGTDVPSQTVSPSITISRDDVADLDYGAVISSTRADGRVWWKGSSYWERSGKSGESNPLAESITGEFYLLRGTKPAAKLRRGDMAFDRKDLSRTRKGSVLRDAVGVILEAKGSGLFKATGSKVSLDDYDVSLPATVIDVPASSSSRF